MTDQNRKTLRSFYCRDYLWELFEQMAQELGCSMDYLINESMRQYARNRDYAVGEPQEAAYAAAPQAPGFGAGNSPGLGAPPQTGGERFNVGGYGGGQGMDHRTFDRVPAVGSAPRPPQAPPQPPSFPQRPAGGPPPPPPRPNAGGGWPQQEPPQAPRPPQAPSQPSFGAEPAFGGSAQVPVFLSFNNNRYTIDKEKFVIGRGSQQTDLTIRDGNISRKHCMVIHRNGAYYIKDMGSTNGVEFRGNRIESKKIEEGDVFYLCDYELRFSFRG
ncbi:hypothetical protein DL240_13300 [Lujinxingia litoralis]|uniref:FHA domain-containing protein n=1 Tax=Lujinxingia litoralis TaxID=2211119 RepID=A0A328C4A3_9DELT|nr:FHA domain-containing protein [Lujinxingia litoralis]RAL21822.1 hypothetical protein DL240_13300 [Lujinxingia litoralis]